MKKPANFLIALVLSLSLCACGSNGDPEPIPVADPEESPTLSSDSVIPDTVPAPIPEAVPEVIPDPPAPAVPNTPEPEQLQGVWLQTGLEVEGYVDAALPGIFNSLIFRTDENGALLADAQSGNYIGFTDRDSYFAREVTLLDQPLYEGCGNDVWSVRVGGESPLNEYGYPSETEIYVTLIDQNTLLQQHYYSFDGGPGVSYQTYKRFLPDALYDMDDSVLAGGIFELSGYIDANGVRHDDHPVYSDFRLTLYADGGYAFTSSRIDSEGNAYSGGGYDWILGTGGTVWLLSDDPQDGFGGAVSDFEGTELLLWDNMDGILCLKYMGQDDYVDTMDDLEGAAFAAPAEALLVYYGDGYLDMNSFRDNQWVQYFALADGPDARQILFSSVNDDTTVWLESDGIEVANLGTMMAGESFIIQLGYPESDGSHLCFAVGGEEYYIELSHSSLSLNMWDYIVTD